MINNYQINNLDDLFGHQELLQENGVLKQMLNKKYLMNLILVGPSGIGKTTILSLLVKKLNVDYIEFNPLLDKKEKLVEFIKKNSLLKKVVIIDEIHNMNKDKQDILLEALQNQTLYMFASTTSNPFFSLNNALISRSFLIHLNNITQNELKTGLIKWVNSLNLKHDYFEVIDYISKYLYTDIRKAINILILIINLYDDVKTWDFKDILFFIKNNQVFKSVSSTEFHDLKSAFHKSLRGSDPDASLYYLYLLIKTGDYQAIYRRLIACTYEDVALANSNLTIKVMSAINACLFLGEKEAFNVLAYITLEIALSPKSNSSYLALHKVKDLVDSGKVYSPPSHLNNGTLKSDSLKKNKNDYLYPHNFKNDWIKQQYLPNEIINEKFYEPNLYNNYETKIMEYWRKIKTNE
ncbi:MAG: AAA family ATPase [Mycoplasmataceae bacterium]|nr:AAA family ATPase [Mycoplasmataceae bacterium]